MSLICLSFSHQRVPISFRERVYFDPDAIANACARFQCGEDRSTRILEFLILSTCNRTEFYAYTNVNATSSPESAQQLTDELYREIYHFISQARGIELTELADHSVWIHGPDVAKHLSQVACGMESLVLGEPQILGQVGDALKMGLAMNSVGAVLSKLFQSAIRAGRRARTETEINQHSLNVSTVAVNTAEKELGNLQGKTTVVLGAGEMADLALRQLRKRGVTDIHVVNRTIERAEELSQQHNGQAYVFEQITKLLPLADILISSTGAPHTLITKEMIQFAMSQRPEQKMMILDIAVPRDVDAAVEEIPNVSRCDVDDLYVSTGHSAALRKEQVPAVESIVHFEVNQFLAWLRSIGVESIVTHLRKKAESIRSHELSRLAQLLPDQGEEAWSVIDRFAKSLVNKILHDPTQQLRELHGSRGAVNHAEAIRELFRLHTLDPSAVTDEAPSDAAANSEFIGPGSVNPPHFVNDVSDLDRSLTPKKS